MIGIVAVLLLGVALSLDTFAVSLTIGVCCCSTPFQRRRFLILMGLFHIAFTLIGWLCGSGVHKIIETFDHWIAFGVLAFLGVKMIYESFSSDEEDSRAVSLALRNTLLLCVAGYGILTLDADGLNRYSLGCGNYRHLGFCHLGCRNKAGILLQQ